MAESIIEIKGLCNVLGGVRVHDDLNFEMQRGEIMGIIGGSGSGKTTLLRNIWMLLAPTKGSIRLFGEETVGCSEKQAYQLRQRFGVMFQQGALFSGLTVLENVLFPLTEFAHLDPDFAHDLALLKIKLVGLPVTAAQKFPAELSGGMIKRAAAARSLALDPELLFLDEPTSGLDPKSSADFDSLILDLRDMLGLSIVIVTHDAASLQRLTHRVAFLGQGKVLACGPVDEVRRNPNPVIQDYFS
ncbi:MAG: ATP-binding cassette domain-containing protein [Gammaproteobacteria bacterium]|nr:ATP-binding cassette domain-containing protein [Gammaproteobacteria bacterium]